MSDALVDEIVPRPVKRFVPLIKGIALVATIIGAIPTAITIYHAWTYKIPYSQVSHRLTQYDLWIKNLDCTIDYKALSTAGGTKVDVGACQKTGDISIKISAEDGKATYEWIAYNQLQKPGEAPKSQGVLDLIFGAARAADGEGRIQLAQSNLEVMCKSLVSGKIVQIVKEGGQCYREVVSPMRSSVESREPVACDAKCK